MKRVLSLLLAVAMLIGFIPASFASEANDENFKISYRIAEHIDELKLVAQQPEMSVVNYNATSGFYRFFSGDHSKPQSGRFTYSEDCFVLADGRRVSFEIRVPVAGTYNLEMFHGINDEGLDVEVYVSRDVVATTEDTLVGRYSTYDESIDYGKYYNSKITEAPSVIEGVTFPEAGAYIISFISTDDKDGNTNWIYGSVGSFNLVMGDGSGVTYMGARLTSDKGMVKRGETYTLSPDARLSDGTKVDVTLSDFESSDERIATVDANGVVSGIEIGEAVITFKASYGGKSDTLTINMTVEPENGITIKYDLVEQITKHGFVANKPAMTVIDKESTDGFFSFHSGDHTTQQSGRFTYSERCFVIADGRRLSFEIFVPRSGIYSLEMFHATNDAALDVEVYLGNDDNLLEKKVGSYSCYNADIPNSKYYSSVIVDEPSVIKGIEIEEAGTYVISFIPTDGKDGNTNWIYANVGNFNLISGSGSALMGIDLIDLNKTKVKVVGNMSDKTQTMDIPGAEISFESSDNSIATVDENGYVTDHKTGEVTITATARCEGFTHTASGTYNAFIQDKGISAYYDLVTIMKNEGMTNSGANAGTAPTLDAITREATDGYFAFHSATQKTHQSGRMMYSDTCLAMADGYSIAFEVFVPMAGVYNLEMYNAENDAGLDVDVFVSRDGASKDDADKVGTYDTYSESFPYSGSYFTQITKTPRVIENIKILEPGYYVFNFVANDGNPGSTTWIYGNVGSFRLVSGGESVLVGMNPSENVEDIEIITIGAENTTLEYTDPDVPATEMLTASVKKTDGTVVDSVVTNKKFRTYNKNVVTVDSEGLVTAVGDGTSTVSMSATVDGTRYSAEIDFTAIDNTGVVESYLSASENMFVREVAKISLLAEMTSGNVIEVPSDKVTFNVSPDGVGTVDKNGMLTAAVAGNATVSASASFRGADLFAEADIIFIEHEGKSEPNYYTYEKRANAMANAEKYSWAKSTVKTAVAKADKHIEVYEQWYDLIPGPGVPSSMNITQMDDTAWNICHYCGINLSENYGNYSSVNWGINPITRPWKIQCPHCRRLFPSNDFALLYSRGVDEKGYYDRDRAVAANAEAVANGEKDALRNELYPEIATVATINCNQGLRPGETVEGWGVDDGFGYLPKNENGANYKSGNITERHCYIAAYHYMLWMQIEGVVDSFADAYVYTDDMRYGRAGAVLLDRIADVYPDYDTRTYNLPNKIFFMGDAGTGYGKIRGKIADCAVAEGFCMNADQLYPALFDTQVITFLTEKAKKFGTDEKNDKSSSQRIWENWESGIALETFKAAKLGLLSGNFGMHQASVAAAAIVLDREPETTEMVKWIYKTGAESAGNAEGGNVLSKLVDIVSRDGLGNEAADNYNVLWATLIQNAAQYLAEYEGEASYDLYAHPKYAAMFTPFLAKTLVGIQSPNVGDSGATGSIGWNGSVAAFATAFGYLKDTPFAKDLAQFIYMRNKYEVDDLNYGIFSEDPEAIQDEILALATDGPLTRSDMLAGYGIAVLRDGYDNKSASPQTAENNQRDFWVYFGRAGGHGHPDTMNLGIDAFGYSFAPDMGYPAITGKDPFRLQWDSNGLSHNTVTIDGGSRLSDNNAAFPMHYDDSGMVKLIDANSPESFKQADEYRRTVVMVNAGDDVSYGVDFFRIVGGSEHTYSFHAAAEDATPVYGLSMTEQKDEDGNWIGSYASAVDENGVLVEGVNVPYTALDGTKQYFTGPGQDPWTRDLWSYETCFTRGYSWLSKVRRDKAPESVFSIDFNVNDYRNVVPNEGDTHLRVTQLNAFDADEVAIVGGPLPIRADNSMFPKTFDYMLVHHRAEGDEKLDSLFTTVYEPYSGNRYISNITPVEVTGEISDGNVARAVRVEHTSGRVDYVVYATDNTKTYRVADLFDFRGFVGVYSVNSDGKMIYRYVNDGDIIGDATNSTASYSGTVVDFDKAFEFGDFENWIDVAMDCDDLDALVGNYMYIETDRVQNGAYKIHGAEYLENGNVRLDIGTISLVRSFVDPDDDTKGYVYNIEDGQTFTIPLAYSEDKSPVFDKMSDTLSTSAGSALTIKVNATSPITEDAPTIKYVADVIPRGATLDEETGTLVWRPNASQLGENHMSVTARDSDGRESTLHFTVNVYGSTTGGSSKPDSSGSTDTPSAPAGGGGGGGGGGGAAPSKPETPTEPEKEEEKEEPATPETPDVETPAERFVDLGAHAWAKDAINSLADAGIIKGTSETTFSPAANITRADFTILLVRAFELTSDNTENFADVSDTDYFAKELAIARNTGVVNGIGDNKYAPRNPITRQDMMTIVYRAMTTLGKDVGETTAPEMTDFDTVADYAKDAVASLVNAGLVNGKNGLIAPTDYTTRAEVAVLIKRITDYKAAGSL